VDSNRIFVSAGYGHGAILLEVAAKGSHFEARPVWESHRMKNKFSGSVLHDGYIYGLDEAILACIEVESGRLMWKGGRYGYGQVLLASGHLIVTTEKGDLVLVKASPENHQELARFSAVEGKTWNNPAIAGGRILVRNTREMVSYRISP
jgi:outer membrane protein assembly factor BamB